jgi:hypothetical protein
LSHLREQLVREAGELGIEITLVENRLLLSGTVATLERRALVERIARSMCNTCRVVNEIHVALPSTPEPPEQLS